jgi:methyl-accepting chemotaxis protein
LHAYVAAIDRSATRSKVLLDQISGQGETGDRPTAKLEAAAAFMSGVLQMIQGVGEQINLSALKASIKAARAGEVGAASMQAAAQSRTEVNDRLRALAV